MQKKRSGVTTSFLRGRRRRREEEEEEAKGGYDKLSERRREGEVKGN